MATGNPWTSEELLFLDRCGPFLPTEIIARFVGHPLEAIDSKFWRRGLRKVIARRQVEAELKFAELAGDEVKKPVGWSRNQTFQTFYYTGDCCIGHGDQWVPVISCRFGHTTLLKQPSACSPPSCRGCRRLTICDTCFHSKRRWAIISNWGRRSGFSIDETLELHREFAVGRIMCGICGRRPRTHPSQDHSHRGRQNNKLYHRDKLCCRCNEIVGEIEVYLGEGPSPRIAFPVHAAYVDRWTRIIDESLREHGRYARLKKRDQLVSAWKAEQLGAS